MSTLGLVLVILGVAIVISRAPFVIAPEHARVLALRMLATDGQMRAFGFLVALLGAVLTWVGGSASGIVAQVVFIVGFVWLLAAALFMIPFPGRAISLARPILRRLSARVLRIMGALAVLFGALIALYGYTL